MSKYCEEIVTQICELIEKDSYTDKEICEKVDISRETFYSWKAEKPDFSDNIKRAEQKYLQFIVVEARKSLTKKIQGYTVQEKRTVYNSDLKEGKAVPKIKEQTITDKHYQPDTTAIIFALCNQDSDNFKNKTTIAGDKENPLISPFSLLMQQASQSNDSGSNNG